MPTARTLARYGLTAVAWRAILRRQGGVCAICRRVPASGRWVTDHEHTPGWKYLPAVERARYVRGIICPFCNSHVCGRFVTLLKARNLVAYLEAYLCRNPECDRPPAPPRRRRRKSRRSRAGRGTAANSSPSGLFDCGSSAR